MISIKSLSKKLNISSRALRYYEELGLIKSQKINQQRHFHNEEVEKLELIILLRKIDLSLKDIKALLDNYHIDNLKKIIKNKISEYYDKIEDHSKKLYSLIQIEKKISNNHVMDVILHETAKVLNQDKERVELVKQFFKLIADEQYSELSKYLDYRMNIDILKKAFIDDMELNNKDYQLEIYHHLSYYNNMLFIKLIKGKTHIIRFVFDDNNIIIGIWLDKVY